MPFGSERFFSFWLLNKNFTFGARTGLSFSCCSTISFGLNAFDPNVAINYTNTAIQPFNCHEQTPKTPVAKLIFVWYVNSAHFFKTHGKTIGAYTVKTFCAITRAEHNKMPQKPIGICKWVDRSMQCIVRYFLCTYDSSQPCFIFFP